MQIDSVVIGIIIFIVLLSILFLILSVANFFLKRSKPDQENEDAESGQISLEDRLESLRELTGAVGPESRFRRLNQADLELPENIGRRAVVYESTDDDPLFLVLPTSYVITRSDSEASPLLKMVAVLDAENSEENKVIFKFTVVPNLLPYHLAYLQSAVKNYLNTHPDSGKREKVPNICLPTDISDAPEVIWENSFTQLDSYTTDGKSLIIWVEANSVKEAAAAARLLQPDPTHQGLHGKVRFPLDEEQSVQSSILANMDNTVGEAIRIEQGKKEHTVSILNRTESPVQIQRLMIFTKDTPEPDILELDSPKSINSGNRCFINVPEEGSEILADYKVKVSQEKELSELRVDVGEIELLLAVDTDIQPDETFRVDSNQRAERLSAIRITLDWDQKDPVTTTLTANEEGGKTFSRKKIPFIVSLDRYLEPQKRILEYSVTFILTGGTQLQSEKLRHNYSDTRLTVRRQVLKNLLMKK